MNLLKILPTVPFMDTARGYGLQMSRDYSKKKKRPQFQKIEDLELVLEKGWQPKEVSGRAIEQA